MNPILRAKCPAGDIFCLLDIKDIPKNQLPENDGFEGKHVFLKVNNDGTLLTRGFRLTVEGDLQKLIATNEKQTNTGFVDAIMVLYSTFKCFQMEPIIPVINIINIMEGEDE